MNSNPVVDRITIYPVKSLDGICLQQVQIGNGGSLVHDREYAICDSNGKFVKGKNNELVYRLRQEMDFENEIISFRHENENEWERFHIHNDTTAINEYISAFFKMPVTLISNTNGKFLDVPVLSGITVLSEASLKAVCNWFGDMHLEESRKRFRANIELTGAQAFWEDKLFLQEGTAVEFKIGNIVLYGTGPRARCVVPSRHPETGSFIQGFQKSFAQQRTANLPAWSTLKNYEHAYYLSVDCYLPPTEYGKWIRVGDEVVITGKQHPAGVFLF
jgi:uncharacterized protein YcbX